MKKKTSRRILCLVFALVMCVGLGVNAFAAEIAPVETDVVEASEVNLAEESVETLADNPGNNARSSINGYKRKTITASNNYIEIPCNGVGLGGMGITIKTSSSSSGNMNYSGATNEGLGFTSSISGSIPVNGGNVEHHNLVHDDIGSYYIFFTDLPAGASVDVQVWIYG